MLQVNYNVKRVDEICFFVNEGVGTNHFGAKTEVSFAEFVVL